MSPGGDRATCLECEVLPPFSIVLCPLHASAPDLLAALEGLLAELKRRDWPEGGPWVGLCNKMDAGDVAIRKARGE